MDDDSNWAILHRTCNRKKGEKPLYLAKRIYRFQEDKKRFGEKFTLGKVLEVFNIHPKPIKIKIDNDYVHLKYEDFDGKKDVIVPILKDPTGTEFDSIFTVLPVHHVFHDSELNPRPLERTW